MYNEREEKEIRVIWGASIYLLILCMAACLFMDRGTDTGKKIFLWRVYEVTSMTAFPVLILLEGLRMMKTFRLSRKSFFSCIRHVLDLAFWYAVLSFLSFLLKIRLPLFYPIGGPNSYSASFFRAVPAFFLLYILAIYGLLFLPEVFLLALFRKTEKRGILALAFALLLTGGMLFLSLWGSIYVGDTADIPFEPAKLATFSVFFQAGILTGFLLETCRKETDEEPEKKSLKKWILPGAGGALILTGIILFLRYYTLWGLTPVFRMPVYGTLIMTAFLPLLPLAVHFCPFGKKSSGKESRKVRIRDRILAPFSSIQDSKRFFRGLGKTLLVFFTILCITLFFSAIWLVSGWGDLSMDEVIFHIVAPAEGTSKDVIVGYMQKAGIPILAVLLLLLAVRILFRKRKKVKKWFLIALPVAGVVLLLSTWFLLDKKMQVYSFLRAQFTDEDFIKDRYTDPAATAFTFPEKKRNLIFIFLESMETTYGDAESGGAFPESMIPNLTAFSREGENFSGHSGLLNGGYVTTGTGFTSGAMFAMTSGLPLKVSMFANDMNTQENFFPNITCLGDILSENGYHTSLLLGSEAAFGGRELMYRNHGCSDIKDLIYYREQGTLPEDYYVWWGYEDEKLFAYAKEELLAVSQGEEPFIFSMLTADTHFEDGYVCRLCDDHFGSDQYANVIRCSDRQIAEFISWIKEQDFYENTTIILTGDHTTMDTDFCDGITPGYQRRFYFTVLNGAASCETEEPRIFTAVDVFPTTLASIGVEIPGNRLGLGVNLYSSVPTLPEELGLGEYRQKVLQNSDFMQENGDIDFTENLVGTIRDGIRFQLMEMTEDGMNATRTFRTEIRLKYRYERSPGSEGIFLECYENGAKVGRSLFTYDRTYGEYNYYTTNITVPERAVRSGDDLEFRVVYQKNGESTLFFRDEVRDLDLELAQFEAYLDLLQNPEYIVFMAAKDEAVAGLNESSIQRLRSLGVSMDFANGYQKGYCFVRNGESVLQAESKEKEETVTLTGTIPEESLDYSLFSAGLKAGDRAIIELDGVDYSKNYRGFDFVVYKKSEHRVVHTVSFDTHDPETWNRTRQEIVNPR